jgi:hypothetical protein
MIYHKEHLRLNIYSYDCELCREDIAKEVIGKHRKLLESIGKL